MVRAFGLVESAQLRTECQILARGPTKDQDLLCNQPLFTKDLSRILRLNWLYLCTQCKPKTWLRSLMNATLGLTFQCDSCSCTQVHNKFTHLQVTIVELVKEV